MVYFYYNEKTNSVERREKYGCINGIVRYKEVMDISGYNSMKDINFYDEEGKLHSDSSFARLVTHHQCNQDYRYVFINFCTHGVEMRRIAQVPININNPNTKFKYVVYNINGMGLRQLISEQCNYDKPFSPEELLELCASSSLKTK